MNNARPYRLPLCAVCVRARRKPVFPRTSPLCSLSKASRTTTPQCASHPKPKPVLRDLPSPAPHIAMASREPLISRPPLPPNGSYPAPTQAFGALPPPKSFTLCPRSTASPARAHPRKCWVLVWHRTGRLRVRGANFDAGCFGRCNQRLVSSALLGSVSCLWGKAR